MFPTISPLGLKKYKYRMHVATLEILHTLFLLIFGLVSNVFLNRTKFLFKDFFNFATLVVLQKKTKRLLCC